MNELRLDYFLSLGLELVNFDECMASNQKLIVSGSCAAGHKSPSEMNEPSDCDSTIFIESFAPRKNEGVQPCSGNIPVIIKSSGLAESALSHQLAWSAGEGKYSIDTWTYDIEALIKMQCEHDREQVKPKRTKESTSVVTLESLGYSWNGGDLWKPPMGSAPEYIKPSVKVEYVKVDKNEENGKFWEVARQYAESECEFFTDGNVHLPVNCNNTLLENYKSGLLHRKVEREVTWQDELSYHLKKTEVLDGVLSLNTCASFCGNSQEESEFIAMCHLVTSLTK